MKAVFDCINQNSDISSAIWMKSSNLLDKGKRIEKGFVRGREGGDRHL